MKILIFYFDSELRSRKTIYDHLLSFERYHPCHRFYYFNLLWKFPKYLKKIQFDAIILHYSVLAVRWDQGLWQKKYREQLSHIADFHCQKIALPQDENAHTKDLCDLFKKIGIKTVYTCAYPEEYQKLYPKEATGLKHYFTTYTGFIDEETLERIQQNKLHQCNRKIDIGYRARNVPFWLGKHGRIKKQLADVFLSKQPNDLKLDVSTEEKDVFYGNDWLNFLLRCRTTLGCLGGASLLDLDGEIRKKVDEYVFLHPNASFEEVEKLFFPSKDGNLSLFALSPRHFECAMTKTCQVLVEGDYNGVLQPGIHYIELKKDFSNITKVLDQIRNHKLCSEMAERTYQDVVLSGKYTYKAFSQTVLDHIQSQINNSAQDSLSDKLVYPWLHIRRRYEKLFIRYTRYRYAIKFLYPRRFKKLLLLIQHKFPLFRHNK